MTGIFLLGKMPVVVRRSGGMPAKERQLPCGMNGPATEPGLRRTSCRHSVRCSVRCSGFAGQLARLGTPPRKAPREHRHTPQTAENQRTNEKNRSDTLRNLLFSLSLHPL